MSRRAMDADRRRKLVLTISALLCLGGFPQTSGRTRHLTFEVRVRAQEAIERVYYSHQIGTSRPFEEAVPRTVLEHKVRTYLKQSVAVEKIWKTPITEAALQRELERIAANTRFPERVEEIYSALGNDPVLILESFARPVLLERLTHSFFSFDQRVHATARAEAEDLRRRLESGVIDVADERSDRQVVELVRRDDSGVLSGGSPSGAARQAGWASPEQRLELSPEEFERWRARAPRRVGQIGPVVEERDAFVVSVVLDETSGATRLAFYRVPKIGWNVWWGTFAGEFDEASVKPIAGTLSHLPAAASRKSSRSGAEAGTETTAEVVSRASPTCVPDDTWDNGILDDLPMPRYRHTAVWTGKHMIVWGGVAGDILNSGARYDPLTDAWLATSTINAPAARQLHTAVWTGALMVIWGGNGGGNSPLATGGRYDPLRDSWEPTSTVGVPVGRIFHTAVWTGSEMIVWGGARDSTMLSSGGRYDPATDTWSATSTAGAPSPRFGHTAVWTGSQMIVWGGGDQLAALDSGSRYDPASDGWVQTSTSGAPSPRGFHTVVWTGSEMIVWGGNDNVNTGGRYDPVSDSWTPTSTIAAPRGRSSHTAEWTGREMIVWGGHDSSFDFDEALDTGGRYDPASDSWAPTSMTNAPSARAGHAAAWTGSRMIVWGGISHVDQGKPRAFFNTGGRYDPASDSWTPTSVLGTPGGVLCCHTAVWTGNLMIVWGGLGETYTSVNSGARYDLMTDNWTPTSMMNVPAARYSHQAVWSGTEMIVWGGPGHNDGGRYDPVSDEWRPISITGAPSPRYLTTPAIWTGSEMIIWGGSLTTVTTTNTGGRYNPAADTWLPTSTVGAPSPREDHTAVWTGREMIIWGGIAPFQGFFNTGARYDPVSDSWRPVSLAGAPSARYTHNAVWTGSLMIVWGGDTTGGLTGGRYDPATDTWTPTSTANAPVLTDNHTALWTGKRMIIWSDDGTGGLYDPAADAWAPTSTTNAPSYAFTTPNADATAVWTGGFMIVWAKNWGGMYALEQSVDNDGDGYSDCAGDCDDTNSLVWFTPVEVSHLQLSLGSPTSLSWDNQGSLVGWGTQYDLAAGVLLPLVGMVFGSSICLTSTTDTTYGDSRSDPEAGTGFWYLVRGRNTCGVGTYGTALRDKSVGSCP